MKLVETILPDPLAWPVILVFSALFGACVGSFLNVCIYRIPREESVVRPRSRCPSCLGSIPWYLNLPVASYFLLGGRCRACRSPISFRYPLVELVTALLFVLISLQALPVSFLGLAQLASPLLIPVYWLFAAGLILGSFVDIDHMIIPDRVSIGGMIAGLILSFLVPAMHNTTTAAGSLLAGLTGLVAGWGSLWTIATVGSLLLRKEAMGFGDVKLMGAIGAFLGWRAVFFTIMVSSLLGSIGGISLMLAGGGKLQSRIPYGPYIALAALIWLLWGPVLWDAYFAMMRPDGGW